MLPLWGAWPLGESLPAQLHTEEGKSGAAVGLPWAAAAVRAPRAARATSLLWLRPMARPIMLLHYHNTEAARPHACTQVACGRRGSSRDGP